MENKDAIGTAHYPGWGLPVLEFLYQDRKITASGHETTDTDPGLAMTKDDYSLETYILSTNHYQIELLTNLDQTPESGALVVVSFRNQKLAPDFRHASLPFCPKADTAEARVRPHVVKNVLGRVDRKSRNERR